MVERGNSLTEPEEEGLNSEQRNCELWLRKVVEGAAGDWLVIEYDGTCDEPEASRRRALVDREPKEMNEPEARTGVGLCERIM